jgi:hypothetical protein
VTDEPTRVWHPHPPGARRGYYLVHRLWRVPPVWLFQVYATTPTGEPCRKLFDSPEYPEDQHEACEADAQRAAEVLEPGPSGRATLVAEGAIDV